MEFCLTGCLIGHDALPFLDPFLCFTFRVLPPIVKLVQFKGVVHNPNHKFLLHVDNLQQISDQLPRFDIEHIYLLIVIDAVILQVDHVLHLILYAVELVLVHLQVGNEEVSDDLAVLRGIFAVLLQDGEDLMNGFAIYHVFKRNVLFWSWVNSQDFAQDELELIVGQLQVVDLGLEKGLEDVAEDIDLQLQIIGSLQGLEFIHVHNIDQMLADEWPGLQLSLR